MKKFLNLNLIKKLAKVSIVMISFQLNLISTPLLYLYYCIPLYSSAVYCIPLYSTAVYCITLYSTAVYCITLYSTAVYCVTLYSTAVYCIPLYSTAVYCITLYSTAVYCIPLYFSAVYCIQVETEVGLQVYHTGCQMKHDTWSIVLNVFFHIFY